MLAEAPVAAAKRPARWKVAANLAVVLVLVGVFAWQVLENRQEIAAFDWSLHWGLAALALALLLFCSFADILIWNRTLGWFTDPLPFAQAAPVYIWSFLARYIPGKVGSLILRVALAAEVQRQAVPVLAASAVELALRVAAGLLVFLAALLGWGFPAELKVRLAAAIPVPLVLICAHPKVMLRAMNWGLRLIKQPPVQRQLRYREILGIFAILLARWLVYGLSYVALACAIYPAARAHGPVLIGAAAGTWAAGFISMVPGGVAVIELAQKTILGSLGFPLAVATMLPVLSRLWTLIGEGLWSLAAWALRRRSGPLPGNQHNP